MELSKDMKKLLEKRVAAITADPNYRTNEQKEEEFKTALFNKSIFQNIYSKRHGHMAFEDCFMRLNEMCEGSEYWHGSDGVIIDKDISKLWDIIQSGDNKEEQKEMERLIWSKLVFLRERKFGFTERGKLQTFDNYDVTPGNAKYVKKSKDYAARIIENIAYGHGLIMKGKAGTGKTHLANAILHQIALESLDIAVYVTCKFGSFMKILNSIKSNFSEELDIISEFCGYDLLVLDDIGKEYMTDWSRQILYMVINDRYEAKKSTIITTNLNSKDLSEKIDSATVSRLLEVNAFMDFDKIKDYRVKKHKELDKDMFEEMEG